jgi:hypothetical protein
MTLLTPPLRVGRLLLLPALVAIITLLFLLQPAPAPAARGMEVAIQDDAVLVGRLYYNRDQALNQIGDLGATRLRVNLTWVDVLGKSQSRSRKQPHRIVYHWGKYDEIVNVARARGMRVHLTVTGKAPRWATGNRRIGVYRPDSGKFGAFARSAAQHFRGRVDRYSVWNEPNYKGWLQPHRKSPRIYRGLYAAAWRGIKSADPHAKVLIGETSPFFIRGRAIAPLKFLRGVTCTTRRWKRRCKGLRADGYAHHPYEFKHSPSFRYPGKDNVTIGTLGRLNKALTRLRRNGALRTPRGGALHIWLTEFGYFATGKYRMPAGRRAKYLRRAFTIARRNPRVHSMLQYLLVTPPRQWAFFNTSLMSPRGTPTASYWALRGFAR